MLHRREVVMGDEEYRRLKGKDPQLPSSVGELREAMEAGSLCQGPPQKYGRMGWECVEEALTFGDETLLREVDSFCWGDMMECERRSLSMRGKEGTPPPLDGEGKWNHWEKMVEYCEQDVQVLYKVMQEFRSQIMRATDFQCFKLLSFFLLFLFIFIPLILGH